MRWPRLFRKDSAVGSLVYAMTLGRVAFPQRDALKLATEGYRQQLVAFVSIRMVAMAVAMLEWDLYQENKGGEDTEIENHPVLDLIARPNPIDDAATFFEKVVTYYLISGNAYVEKVAKTIPAGEPMELYPLRSDRIKIVPDQRGYPGAYDYTVNQQTYRFDPASILHIATPNPTDDWYGLSPLEAAGFSIDVHTGSGGLLKALLDNSARPSGAFVYKGDTSLTQDQRENLRSQVAEMYAGTKNAGRPMLLDGSIEWQEIGLNLSELQYTEGKNQAAREIALAIGVPPLLLGIPGDNTFANYEEANRAFWRMTVLPIANRLCRSFGRFLLPAYQGGETLFFSYDEDEIPALASERAAKWAAIQGADFLTVNEKREALGYEAITGGEVLLVPAAMVPLTDVGLMPEGGAGSSTADDDMDEEEDPAEGTDGKSLDQALDALALKLANTRPVVNVSLPAINVAGGGAEPAAHGKVVTITKRDERGRPIAARIMPVVPKAEPLPLDQQVRDFTITGRDEDGRPLTARITPAGGEE